MNFDLLNSNADLSNTSLNDIRWALFFRFNTIARTFKIGPGSVKPLDTTHLMLATRIELASRYRKLMLEASRIPTTVTVDALLMNQNFTVDLSAMLVTATFLGNNDNVTLPTLSAGEVVELPIARGMPVVTIAIADSVSTITSEKVRLTPFSVSEIETINAIAEVVTLDNGEFVGKPYPHGIFRSAKVWADAGVEIANELNTVFDVDKKPVCDMKSRPLTASGKAMVNAIIGDMVKARSVNTTAYRAMCMRFIDSFDIARFVIPSRIGDFDKDSLEYAYYILRETRGIRGGDKKDSTLAGSAFYLDVTIDNRYAKSARDITDFGNLLGVMKHFLDWTGNIQLKGKHVPTILNRLMLFEVRFSGIIYISCDMPTGWIFNGGCYTNPLFQFKLAKTGSKPNDLIIDYSIPINDDRYLHDVRSSDIVIDYPSNKYAARLGPFTTDTVMTKFFPSAFVHNLTGFHLTFEIDEVVDIEDYIQASIKCNINRTFSMAFPERGTEILDLYNCENLKIRLSTYLRIAKGLKDHIEIAINKTTKFADLFEEVAKDHIADLDKAILASTRVVDVDDAFDEGDVVPAPDGDEPPRARGRGPKVKVPPKRNKRIDFDV